MGAAPLSADLFDSLRDAVLVYRFDGSVRGYNQPLSRLLGGENGLAEKLAIKEGGAPHPIPPLREVWPGLLRGELRTVPFRLTDGAGQVSELEMHGRRIEHADGPLILVELRDITAARRAERALQDSKRQLESAVVVRTRDLQQKIALIEQQRQALLELSTPVIQVWEGVLVVPLIGALDRSRSAQLTESLLDNITSTRSRQVIIDITGVPTIDQDAAAAILRAVRAVELLGATCSLAGISPAVARSIVEMQSDWTAKMRSFANLHAALRAAISPK